MRKEKAEKPRRKKGAGGLYQRESDGMWCCSVELPSDGTKRRRRVIARAKRSDALTELRKLRADLEKNGDLPTASITLAKWCDVWWKRYAMKDLKVSTRDTYRSKIEQYIKPAIGRVKLDRLTVEHVRRLHGYVIETKGLSASTAHGAHRVLSAVLTDAEREGKVARNVARIAAKPKVGKVEKTYLESSQAATLLTGLSGSGRKMLAARWAVAFLLGKRQGECLGITRDAIDLDARQITISWQIKRLPYEHGCGEKAGEKWPCGRRKGGYCPQKHLEIPDDQDVEHVSGGLYMLRPKTSASWHVLPMGDHLHRILSDYLEDATLGLKGLIFHRPDGRPVDPADDNHMWHDLLQEFGLPDVNVHSTRSTCNTILTELGVPVDVRKAILGQASSAVNEAHYTHTSDARVREGLAALGESLAG